MTTYYVASNGSSSNNGTSTGTPFGSPLHLPSLNPGDEVLFRYGDTFSLSSNWVISYNGAPFNWIKFGAYGDSTKTKPAIRRADATPNKDSNSHSLEIRNASWLRFQNIRFIEAGKYNLFTHKNYGSHNIRFWDCEFTNAFRCGAYLDGNARIYSFRRCKFNDNGTIKITNQNWHGIIPQGFSSYIHIWGGESKRNLEDGLQCLSGHDGLVVAAYKFDMAQNGLSGAAYNENEIDFKDGDGLLVDCIADHYNGEGAETVVVHQDMLPHRITVMGGRYRGLRDGTTNGTKRCLKINEGNMDLYFVDAEATRRPALNVECNDADDAGGRVRAWGSLFKMLGSPSGGSDSVVKMDQTAGHLFEGCSMIAPSNAKAGALTMGDGTFGGVTIGSPATVIARYNLFGVKGQPWGSLASSGNTLDYNHYDASDSYSGDSHKTTGAVTYEGTGADPYKPASGWDQNDSRTLPGRLLLRDKAGKKRVNPSAPGCYDPDATEQGLWFWNPLECAATPQIDYTIPEDTTTLVMVLGGTGSPATSGMSIVDSDGITHNLTILTQPSLGGTGLIVGYLSSPPTGDVELRPGVSNYTETQGVRVYSIIGGNAGVPQYVTANGNSTGITASFEANSSNMLVLDFMASASNNAATASGNNQIDFFKGWLSGGRLCSSWSASESAGSTVTMGWNNNSATNKVQVVLAFAPGSEPASGGGASVVTTGDFYVDPVSGSDSNDGSEATPWKTLSKLSTNLAAYSDRNAYLKKGTTFSEQLNLSGIAGASDNRRTIGAYGAGVNPVISVAASDGIVLTNCRDLVLENLDTDGCGGNGLYISNSSSIKVVGGSHVDNASDGINVTGASFGITLEGVTSQLNGDRGLDVSSGEIRNILTKGCSILDNTTGGVYLNSSDTPTAWDDYNSTIRSIAGGSYCVEIADGEARLSQTIIDANGASATAVSQTGEETLTLRGVTVTPSSSQRGVEIKAGNLDAEECSLNANVKAAVFVDTTASGNSRLVQCAVSCSGTMTEEPVIFLGGGDHEVSWSTIRNSNGTAPALIKAVQGGATGNPVEAWGTTGFADNPSSGQVQMTIPDTAVVGQLMMLYVCCDGGAIQGQSVNAPTGWTKHAQQAHSSMCSAVLYKYVEASDIGATLTLTVALANESIAAILKGYDNVQAATPFSDSDWTNSGTIEVSELDVPALDGSVTGNLVVIVAADELGATSPSYPTGFTARGFQGVSTRTGPEGAGIAVADGSRDTVGGGPYTITWAASEEKAVYGFSLSGTVGGGNVTVSVNNCILDGNNAIPAFTDGDGVVNPSGNHYYTSSGLSLDGLGSSGVVSYLGTGTHPLIPSSAFQTRTRQVGYEFDRQALLRTDPSTVGAYDPDGDPSTLNSRVLATYWYQEQDSFDVYVPDGTSYLLVAYGGEATPLVTNFQFDNVDMILTNTDSIDQQGLYVYQVLNPTEGIHRITSDNEKQDVQGCLVVAIRTGSAVLSSTTATSFTSPITQSVTAGVGRTILDFITSGHPNDLSVEGKDQQIIRQVTPNSAKIATSWVRSAESSGQTLTWVTDPANRLVHITLVVEPVSAIGSATQDMGSFTSRATNIDGIVGTAAQNAGQFRSSATRAVDTIEGAAAQSMGAFTSFGSTQLITRGSADQQVGQFRSYGAEGRAGTNRGTAAQNLGLFRSTSIGDVNAVNRARQNLGQFLSQAAGTVPTEPPSVSAFSSMGRFVSVAAPIEVLESDRDAIILVAPEWSDAAILSGTEAIGLPLSHLQMMQPSDFWSAGTTTSPYILVDRGTPEEFDFVSLLFTNFTETSLWRVRSGDDGENWPIDTGWVAAPVSSVRDDWGYRHAAFFFANSMRRRFVRIDIDNGKLAPVAGRLYIGKALKPTYNALRGAGWGFEDPSPRNRTLGSNTLVTPRPQIPTASFTLNYASQEEAWGTFYDFRRKRGASKDVLCVLNPSPDNAYRQAQMLYGLLQQRSSISLPFYNFFEEQYTIEGLV